MELSNRHTLLIGAATAALAAAAVVGVSAGEQSGNTHGLVVEAHMAISAPVAGAAPADAADGLVVPDHMALADHMALVVPDHIAIS
ncbi:hypothetical protein [Kitasatospora sp. NBC_01302]|uniref:hypothetical protein n=1 Tax=Kitasatospora sp. NBC_01302 TaxID=2903575 RepID=UPI002E0D79E1|nr:hypothetical protein OG294_05385 [Kitasatospora sp. NBC_01302]